MKGINLKAIFIGCLVQYGLGVILRTPLTIIYGIILLSRGMSATKVASAPLTTHQDPFYLIGLLVVGTLATGAAGFSTVALAPEKPLLNALLTGISSLTIALAFNSIPVPGWYLLLAFVLRPCSAVLGGWLRLRYQENKAKKLLSTPSSPPPPISLP